ncbi:MAG: CusA/CzcA family heavy metal efflux RND transporter [Planctomycetia bacterium]|nr:CusA/CzcA family heavy metal efflux RND transporter [Planctomycetia bacterium]
MIANIIAWSLSHRLIIAALSIAVCLAGVWSFTQQPIDAYPDISAQQVLIISSYAGRAPEEIERQVTIPIELAMGSVPDVAVIRSRTIFGLSIVGLVFNEGVDKYFARQRVQERLAGITLPDGVQPELGPLATAYGEIYRYELRSDRGHSVTELRTLNDWVVVPRLMRTPGIAEVANFGGYEKQYAVKLDPGQLERYGLSLEDVVSAVQTNNANAGGSVLRRGDMSFVIRGRGTVANEQDIEAVVVNTIGGTPVNLRDVAEVELDHRIPAGIFGMNDRPEAVEGIVLMRRGENPSRALELVRSEMDELNASVLPKGVSIDPFYDRQFLVDSTLHTVTHSVVTGVALVLLVLLAFLGSPRMAILVVATIPFSLLFALTLMYLTGIPIGLLSIGAIDFGILVDGAVIMADNIAHHLSRMRRKDPASTLTAAILAAATEVERPVFFSSLMIICAYVPLLTLTSIEGLLFRPMALTVIYALIGAVIFALFVIPSLATFLLGRGYTDWENPLLTLCRIPYEATLKLLMRLRVVVVGAVAVLFVAVCVMVVPKLGFDFLPYLDEGVIWIRANFPEGTSLEQTAEYGNRMRKIVRDLPDVTFVMSQAGRNDSGTDPFVPSRCEMMVGLKKMDEWQYPSKQAIINELGHRLRTQFPTTRFNFTQPIIDSVTEDTNGTSANLAVEFSGSDSDKLLDLGRQTVAVLQAVPGAVDVNIEQEGPQPQLVVQPDRVRCARYDTHIDDVNRVINTALGGEPIGVLYEGERRFDITARFDRRFLTSPQSIGQLPVFTHDKVPVPLAQVADFELVDGQTFIARESGRRRITVRCDIVGRDQGGFVAEAQKLFAAKVKAPDEIRVRWIGMFENLERASRHFALVIPITMVLIYILLVVTFGNQREALLVLLSVPLAFIGGAIALYVRGMTLNVSSGVGFAALFGVSIMNGVLMVEWISALRTRGAKLERAILEGAGTRMRPILMASLVAILGLLPASVAHGLGSDVQRPLATVIVWGLVSSMLLTLFVVPVLCRMFMVKDRDMVTGPST